MIQRLASITVANKVAPWLVVFFHNSALKKSVESIVSSIYILIANLCIDVEICNCIILFGFHWKWRIWIFSNFILLRWYKLIPPIILNSVIQKLRPKVWKTRMKWGRRTHICPKGPQDLCSATGNSLRSKSLVFEKNDFNVLQ